jgi:hypothetical protein
MSARFFCTIKMALRHPLERDAGPTFPCSEEKFSVRLDSERQQGKRFMASCGMGEIRANSHAFRTLFVFEQLARKAASVVGNAMALPTNSSFAMPKQTPASRARNIHGR